MSHSLSVGVFGTGYVGCVSIGCLARDGFRVVAVDPDPDKVAALDAGRAPIHEPGLDALIAAGRRRGLIEATADAARAVRETDVSLCCVGTPSRADGSLDTRFVREVAEEIGAALRDKRGFHVVALRSTVLPGTVEEIVVPALERASGRRAGEDFGVAYYPEFLREGSALEDWNAPGTIVFGALGGDARSVEVLRRLTAAIPVEPQVHPVRLAELLKYANNFWHAVKISFANEVGNLCKAAGIDSHDLMDVLCADRRLNVSPAYMRPGFAFGGSCLPKDLRALRSFGRGQEVPTPMLEAAIEANRHQLDRAFRLVRRTGERKIGLLGITFKAGTDDVRESPLVRLAERLLGTGHELAIYDPNVSAEGGGTCRQIPHLARYIRADAASVVRDSRALVVGNRDASSLQAIAALDASGADMAVIDLARLPAERRGRPRYEGICW